MGLNRQYVELVAVPVPRGRWNSLVPTGADAVPAPVLPNLNKVRPDLVGAGRVAGGPAGFDISLIAGCFRFTLLVGEEESATETRKAWT